MSDRQSCTSCGACCFSPAQMYVRVMGDDYERLGDDAEQVTTFIGHRCYMRMDSDHCAQLIIEPDGHYRCQVYEQRPDVCRALEESSPACEAEQERKAPLVLIAARELVRSRRSAW